MKIPHVRAHAKPRSRPNTHHTPGAEAGRSSRDRRRRRRHTKCADRSACGVQNVPYVCTYPILYRAYYSRHSSCAENVFRRGRHAPRPPPPPFQPKSRPIHILDIGMCNNAQKCLTVRVTSTAHRPKARPDVCHRPSSPHHPEHTQHTLDGWRGRAHRRESIDIN